MRQQGCRQCEQITSGDCGQHGPKFIPLSHAVPGTQVLPDKDAELAHLRAEVERLQGEVANLVRFGGPLAEMRERAEKADAVVRAAVLVHVNSQSYLGGDGELYKIKACFIRDLADALRQQGCRQCEQITGG